MTASLLGDDVVEQRVSRIAGVIIIMTDQRQRVAVPGRNRGRDLYPGIIVCANLG